MSDDIFGKLCALLAAIAWSCGVPLLQRGGAGLHPVACCIIRNLTGLFLLLCFLVFQDVHVIASFQELRLSQHLFFLASGIIGIAIADTFFFLGAKHLQVGVIGLTQTVYSPLVVIISAVLLHERLSFVQLLGGALVISATVLVKLSLLFQEKGAKNDSRGFFFMVTCVICNVVAVLFLKVSIEKFPVSLLIPYRSAIGVLPLLAWAALQSKDSEVRRQLRSAPAWRALLLGSFFGSALSTTFWVLGFAYTKASLAALINESSALFLLLIGYFVYGEVLSKLRMLSAVLATAGLCLLWL